MDDRHVWEQADIYALTNWAAQDSRLWPHIAAHPQCTPQLRAWIHEQMAQAEQTPQQSVPNSEQYARISSAHGQPVDNPPEDSGQKRGVVWIIAIAIILLLIIALVFTWWIGWWDREAESQPQPSTTASPTASTPAPSASPSESNEPEEPDHPDGWDDIKRFDFDNLTWSHVWVFVPGMTIAENMTMVDGQGTGTLSHIRLAETPVFADANGDGYLDAIVGVVSSSSEQIGKDETTRYYLWIWDPETKKPSQIQWYVAEAGSCMGTVSSVTAAERGFEISGELPSLNSECSDENSIPFTRTIGARGKYPIRLDKPGWGGMCGMHPSGDNLLAGATDAVQIRLGPEAGSGLLPELDSLTAAYAAKWYDDNLIVINDFQQVLITDATNPEATVGDWGCAFVPK
ncbi:MAG: hypothetical protein Q4P05_02945 [Actinomycetaceae bacterium]|nr:hypothetical protein [Actinomycetaceae bacterium]